LDILGSLLTEDGKAGQDGNEYDFDNFLSAPSGEAWEDDGGDEAFIALQQAASFRKASNLKGKSVKKGGGFQAMGEFNWPSRSTYRSPSLLL
jgi:ATP-dependent RNA helicase DDX54/DBP10